LCEKALRELPSKAGEQLVILSQVLSLSGIHIVHFFNAKLQTIDWAYIFLNKQKYAH
jgi:hypothetical protein